MRDQFQAMSARWENEKAGIGRVQKLREELELSLIHILAFRSSSFICAAVTSSMALTSVFCAICRMGKPRPAKRPLSDVYKRQVLYVPETMRCSELLRQFKEKKQRMAVVVDEYGGTEGLVTMEDLLEAIVGKIDDGHDEDGGIVDVYKRQP